ncbi:MAG: glycoside hydrolase family 13 protein [Bacteroidota bacterium]
MLRQSFLYIILSISACTTAQTDIYNDDPMQKLPLGMEESQYRLRSSEGLPQVVPSPTGEDFRVEPPNWWVDMANLRFEIMIYHQGVKNLVANVLEYPGLSLVDEARLENPNYLFLTFEMAPDIEPGTVTIELRTTEWQVIKTIEYELKAKPQNVERGLTSKDFLYLIMPDRFANGDRKNDSVNGMAQQGTNREKFLFRHGGDLLGIMEHLDYLQELGVTAIWLNPVLENDQPYESYHGYAVTDHYYIDRRFGSNEQYRQLVALAKERGIKVIMDVIFNHVGDHHFFIQDLPSEDWIHQWPEFTKTTYRATTLLDPHAAEYDRKLMTDGWFDHHMPDLNQLNTQLANYLIQNSIWWTLYSGQAGFRIDTYAYPDPSFMAEWNKRLLAEFPDLGIFGETWVHGPGVQSWFVGGGHLSQTYDSELPGVTDFQLYYAIGEALGQDPGWTNGVMRLYYTLAQDHLYKDPNHNVVFLDNHDLSRLFTSVGRDETKYRSALALLMTLRGIPMVTYGTEFGFTGSGGGFGEGGRVDFPGGWRKDDRNLFKAEDRTEVEQSRFEYLQRLAQFRKGSPALKNGTLTQFVPRDGLYVYYREAEGQKVVTVFNGHSQPREFNPIDFIGLIEEGDTIYDLTNGEVVEGLGGQTLAGKEAVVLVVE